MTIKGRIERLETRRNAPSSEGDSAREEVQRRIAGMAARMREMGTPQPSETEMVRLWDYLSRFGVSREACAAATEPPALSRMVH
jgi:hypothetical protein